MTCREITTYKYLMKIISAELFQLNIPFRLGFSHLKADRFFCDSIILHLKAIDSSGNSFSGYGEAVIREYVSGKISETESSENAAASAFTRLLAPFREKELDTGSILNAVSEINPPAADLPLLCAVETAILEILCKKTQKDIYRLLGYSPQRQKVFYSGTVPLLPEPAAEKMLMAYRQIKIPSLRIKVGTEPEYNRKILSLAKKIMGDGIDLKVDANAGWSYEDACINIPLIKEQGINIIEEPFGREEESDNSKISKVSALFGKDIIFMADESALDLQDIKKAAKSQTFAMINIRLAKNGGIMKALKLAETAERLGLRYMAGCHVGETGILSAAGRTAASIMNNPEYTDGSFDSHLLSGNITVNDLSFGPGGRAEIIRNMGPGYRINETKLEEFTDEKIRCF